MTTHPWMIYGAYGYTGRLCVERAIERGLRPVLAGRNGEAVRELASQHSLDPCVFGLDDPDLVRTSIRGMSAVLHTAGPFSSTSRPMVDACLDEGVHYLDITGEIAVFEGVFRRDSDARDAGVALIPGVGFDVVPTDGMAAMLHKWMPDATALELAFFGLSSVSAGTARSMVESLGKGGWIRKNGTLTAVPSAYRSRKVAFPSGERTVTTIPWGDLSTAFRSTAIPDILVYTHVPGAARKWMGTVDRLGGLIGTTPVQKGLKWLVDRTVKGPDNDMRERGYSDVWGEVTSPDGTRLEGALTTPEGYYFTSIASVAAVERLLLAQKPPTGALTPSLAFGTEFVLELEGITLHPFLLNGEPVTSEELDERLKSPPIQ